jgi:hypothetical protein
MHADLSTVSSLPILWIDSALPLNTIDIGHQVKYKEGLVQPLSTTSSSSASTPQHHNITTHFFIPIPKFANMVSFRNLALSALAMTAPIMAQTTPAQVVSNIKMITQKSQALQAPAQSLSLVNGPLIIIGQGPFPVCRVLRANQHFSSIANNQSANHHWIH